MDEIRDRFQAGRRGMIDAFAKMSMLASRAGADEHEIDRLHGQFFDGNVAVKSAFRVAVLLASLFRAGRRESSATD